MSVGPCLSAQTIRAIETAQFCAASRTLHKLRALAFPRAVVTTWLRLRLHPLHLQPELTVRTSALHLKIAA